MNTSPHSFQQQQAIDDANLYSRDNARGQRDKELLNAVANFKTDVGDPWERVRMIGEIHHYERMALEFLNALAELKKARDEPTYG